MTSLLSCHGLRRRYDTPCLSEPSTKRSLTGSPVNNTQLCVCAVATGAAPHWHRRHHECLLPCLQDGGDPDVAVSPRDIVYTLNADEAAAAAAKGSDLEPSVLATTDLRCGGVSWCDGESALASLASSVWYFWATVCVPGCQN